MKTVFILYLAIVVIGFAAFFTIALLHR